MRKITIAFAFIMVLVLCVGCGGNKEEKVTCSSCNGTGHVKYYYGNGDDEYNWGTCTGCDGKGYIMVVPKGNSKGGKREICPSCNKYVDELITKEAAAGENRTWCADCWSDYDSMMGR